MNELYMIECYGLLVLVFTCVHTICKVPELLTATAFHSQQKRFLQQHRKYTLQCCRTFAMNTVLQDVLFMTQVQKLKHMLAGRVLSSSSVCPLL